MGVAVPIIAAGVGSLIQGIMSWYGAKQQEGATERVNQLTLAESAKEREQQARQFGVSTGLKKQEMKLQGRLAQQELGEKKRQFDVSTKYAKEQDEWKKRVDFSNRLTSMINSAPGFAQQMIAAQQARKGGLWHP